MLPIKELYLGATFLCVIGAVRRSRCVRGESRLFFTYGAGRICNFEGVLPKNSLNLL